MPRIRCLPLALALSATVLLAGCDKKNTKNSTFTDLDSARADFKQLAAVAERVFWRATDRCMRDSGSGMTQIPESEFTEAHEYEVMDLKKAKAGRGNIFSGTVKIFNPATPTQWFEMEFEEAGQGWRGLDCKLIMDGHEMNYFEGRFLSATDLKPYVDEAIEHVFSKQRTPQAPPVAP